MNRLISAFFANLCLALAAGAQAGTVSPDLQDAMAAEVVAGQLPVIVRFDGELDINAIRKELKRLLKDRHDDPKERRTLLQGLMVDGLKKLNGQDKQALRVFLEQQGVDAKLKELWLINAVAGLVPAELIDLLAQLGGVESVDFDATVQGPAPGTAPMAPTNWNLDMTGAPDLWQLGHTGTGVVVGTMDTGVDATHLELGARWRGGENSWFDPYGQHDQPADVSGHGTRVLGLIVGGDAGGYQVGMAPGAQWIAAKIFNDSNEATLSGIHLGFQWVFDPDGNSTTGDAPDIVNNSWVLEGAQDVCDQEFSLDIALLKEAGIAVVFSAGNYGPASNSSMSPANDPVVLSVGAVNNVLAVTSESSRGPSACDGGVYPHLVAPGESVLTTDLMPGFYNVVSGTSFSVAHVSGGTALLRGAFPQATVSQFESALKATAGDLGDAGPDNDYGYGNLDVAAAYDWLAARFGRDKTLFYWNAIQGAF